MDRSFPWGAFALVLPFTVLTVLVVLAVTFVVALRVGRHTVVDVTWGLGFVAVALVATVAGQLTAPAGGSDVRRWLVLVLTAAWGVRLATHIAARSRGGEEDPRYVEIMSRARGNPQLHAFRTIYLTQGAVMWFVSLPVQVAAFETDSAGVLTWLGTLLWAVGLTFETVGDAQLTRFRRDPAQRGRVLDTGLWRYTRHPNYFGDACVWWGLWLVAADAWPGVLSVLSPLLMSWLLVRVSGKALLERDMAQRRPDYVDYVRRTSGFLPRPPKPSTPVPSRGAS